MEMEKPGKNGDGSTSVDEESANGKRIVEKNQVRVSNRKSMNHLPAN